MADNFASWYQGAMTPPLALPDGSYVPAPLSTPQMSVEDMYRGIYAPSAPSGGLNTNSVRTVAIDPTTGFPYQTPSPTISARAAYAGGAGAGGGGSLNMRQKVVLENPIPGPTPVPKYQDRLPALPVGLPLAGVDGATAGGRVGANAAGQGALRIPNPVPSMGSYRANFNFASPNGFGGGTTSAPVHQLNVDVPAEEGQFYADSMGMPVRSKSGTLYTPKAAATPKQFMAAKEQARQPGGLFGGQGRQGGLLSMLFGGGGGLFNGAAQAPRNAAGRPISQGGGPVINGATHGVTATGSVGDYGSSPGQITAGLQPGERKYDPSTNSWGLR